MVDASIDAVLMKNKVQIEQIMSKLKYWIDNISDNTQIPFIITICGVV